LLGYPTQALRRSQAARTLAQRLSHSHSLAAALNWAAFLHQHRSERQAAQEQVEALIALANEHGFPYWLAEGMILRGWVLAEQGQAEEGMALIRQGLSAYRATGAELFRTYWLALLAEACRTAAQTEAGLHTLGEALAMVDKTGERVYEAELYRLKGEFTLRRSPEHHTEAETCFRQALEVARRQQAKSWELRAAISLGRLWQRQGKHAEARVLLALVYGWFTEGFDTADLQEARALLVELQR